MVSAASVDSANSALVACPKCGHSNSTASYFCTNCHEILIHRCPHCWHEQRDGFVCDKCGTNIPLATELAFEQSAKEDARVQRDKAVARSLTVWQLAILPFTGVAGVVRLLVMRIVSGMLGR